MAKLIKGILLSGILILVPGCAQLGQAVDTLVPKVEAKAELAGVGLSLDTDSIKAIVRQFCIRDDGRTAGVLDKIPILGDFVKNDVIGVCPQVQFPE